MERDLFLLKRKFHCRGSLRPLLCAICHVVTFLFFLTFINNIISLCFTVVLPTGSVSTSIYNEGKRKHNKEMPSPSLFGKRMEISDRTMVRRTSSPQLLERVQPSSPIVHRGLMFADGTPHKGGKGHSSIATPSDHKVLNPPPADHFYVEPIAFLPGGQPIVLGRRTAGYNSGTVTPARSTSPAVSHGTTGRRHLSPAGARDSPIRHDLGRSTASPARAHHKPGTASPRDHFISGVCERMDAVDTMKSTIARGPKHLDGCPAFVRPTFDKRPYTPQTKRVVGKRADNDIFNVQPVEQQQTPTRSTTPARGGATIFSSAASSGGAAVVRRCGPYDTMVTPGRSPPAPYAHVAPSPQYPTPQRSRTPSRASPGSTGYNIITGKPLA